MAAASPGRVLLISGEHENERLRGTVTLMTGLTLRYPVDYRKTGREIERERSMRGQTDG